MSACNLACQGRDKLDMEFRHSLQEQSVPHYGSRKRNLGFYRMSLTLRSGVDESMKTTGRSHGSLLLIAEHCRAVPQHVAKVKSP